MLMIKTFILSTSICVAFGIDLFGSSKKSDSLTVKCREKRINSYDGCDLRKLRISSRNESIEIEDTLKEIKALRIENGIVHYLPENIMKSFPNSLILHVLNSELKSINQNDLKGMTNLEDVNLHRNKIKSLDVDTFKDLKELKSLDMSNNEIELILSKLFQSNTNLETLSLNFNNIEKLHEETFMMLLKLQRLYISNNKIVELRDGTFSENKALISLDLSHNHLSYIGKNIFDKNQETLEKLNLSHNKCINLSIIKFSGTRKKELEKVKSELNEHCRPFPVTKVIEEYEEKFRLLEEGNNITKEEFKEKIGNLTKLWEFEMTLTQYAKNELSKCQSNQTQCITQLNDAESQNKNYLHRLLSCDTKQKIDNSNKVNTNTKLEEKVRQLEEENLKLRNIKDDFEKCSNFELSCDNSVNSSVCEAHGVITPLRNMKIINAKSISVKGIQIIIISDSFMSHLQSNIFETLPNLKHFEATNSNIRQIDEGTFLNAKNLEFVLLKRNHIKFLFPNIFKGAENLQTIKLESNGIEMMSANTFKGLTELKNLHLRNNFIKEIPKDIFNDLKSLEILDLAENLLRHIDGKALQFNINLEKIGIASNPLMSIGEELLDKCVNLKVIYFGKTSCIPEAIKANSKEEFKLIIQEKKCSV
ncbi:CLUMA_CG016779, isoform A [Clunio marinus]|uniref:CLUMA_CG016779, isoform A n=1 Tax=Clunio marinus TaxID=568069 RepID=A0A1J1IYD9_9DIPT|nr:CLUMA_CG016779, isoform A [Clunio marinus]